MSELQLRGWYNRSSGPTGGWVLKPELSENPYMKDRTEARKTQNLCAVFVYIPADPSKGAVHLPNMRAYTREQLLNGGDTFLLDMVGIGKGLREQALSMFDAAQRVVVSFPAKEPRQDVQMAAAPSLHGPAAQLS